MLLSVTFYVDLEKKRNLKNNYVKNFIVETNDTIETVDTKLNIPVGVIKWK